VTTLTATVADVHRITPDVKQFRLVAEEHGFEYEPGGHTMVHFESDGEEEEARPYTAVNLPGGSEDELVLAIGRYEGGNGSVYMHERAPGDEIEVEPVDGDLHLRDPERDAVLLATGTGITPLYPMLEQYAKAGSGAAHLVFGERDREDLTFRESLDRLRAEHGNVTVDYVLSDAGEAWNGRVGHVQDHLPDALDGLDGTEF